ncbi:baseplate J/gp47 family protein [Listeria seeligeri]|uniref:baseplate J/gp47 family protein n=1 Tax=Listeria seeligeri TaxID=1640 RepID=UPI001628C413|nr:baseplate J/gp47 family protein [Listeria seeligeri]MBC1824237.1 baseplate J/gp47 family protein [Listeria seeligeri]MBC1837829.1 baseplate J/gp47 family protein [Listeria seeligeri]HAC0715661.1 phage portal protein [Listeria monocytogenes]
MVKFEEMTFENIMELMLNSVSDELDKREGSLIWNALSPAASQVALLYTWLENAIDLVFYDTAPDEYLERAAAPYGVLRKQAAPAVRLIKGMDDNRNVIEIPTGSRFFIETENVYFKVIPSTNTQQLVECEVAGIVGNSAFSKDTILSLDNIYGLAQVEITDIVIPGSDIEELEAFRSRFFAKIQKDAFSGNKAHYKIWAEEVSGVGKAKIYPLGYGDGTVKIVITDAELQPASDILVQKVSNYINPVSQIGEGTAPIGAKVFVESAVWKTIEISGQLSLKEGKSVNDVIEEITPDINKLFKSITFPENEVTSVKLAVISNIIFSAPSVLDNFNIKLNGEAANIILGENEVPKLGAFSFALI